MRAHPQQQEEQKQLLACEIVQWQECTTMYDRAKCESEVSPGQLAFVFDPFCIAKEVDEHDMRSSAPFFDFSSDLSESVVNATDRVIASKQGHSLSE